MSRSILLFGKRECAEIETLIESALSNWVKQWLGNKRSSVQCTPADVISPEQSNWWYAKPEMGCGIYIQKVPGTTKRLTLALFDPLPKAASLYETPTPLVGDCLSDAITDLAVCTLQALSNSTDQPRPTLIAQAPGEEQLDIMSGAIHARLNFADLTLLMIIPGAVAESVLRNEAVAKSAAASSALSDPMDMILSKPIFLTALLGQAQIDIGTLQSIAIGDVIRFQTRIDQPATLMTGEGTSLCKGYVGSRNNFKSLQLQR